VSKEEVRTLLKARLAEMFAESQSISRKIALLLETESQAAGVMALRFLRNFMIMADPEAVKLLEDAVDSTMESHREEIEAVIKEVNRNESM
jgi:hypothetical protein